MFSRFFIDNPVFTNVIAIITLILGAVAMTRLPVALYPDITPPTVSVNASYPGADAQTMADRVGSPIELQVNGVENMLYMSSTSADSGDYTLTVTFALGTDVDMALVLLQNQVNNALPLLPDAVQQQGVTVTKHSPSILQVIAVTSPSGVYDNLFLANYANLHIQNVLARVAGVGQVQAFGAGSYAMRVWLDMDKLHYLGIGAAEVNAALSQQNVQVAAGNVGGRPCDDGQIMQLTVLVPAQQVEDVIIKTLPDNRFVRLRDVARVELGAQSYSAQSAVNGKNAALLAVYLLPGANALHTAEGIATAMRELERDFPPDMAWSTPFNTATFAEEAVQQVYATFFKAVLLVMLVVLLFLQNVRAAVSPALVIPVTLLGAFGFLYLAGFSVNMISLFALVLAIGLIVDDAIIVVEATMLHIERGETPADAAAGGMKDLFVSVIAVMFVFASVFLPASMLDGITGQLYRQFALVIGATALLSALFAVSLTPTECALLLRRQQAVRPTETPPAAKEQAPEARTDFPEDKADVTHGNALCRLFNRCYNALHGAVLRAVGLTLRHPVWALVTYAVITGAAIWGGLRLPRGFLPDTDQGYVLVSAQLPDAAASPRTTALVRQMERVFATVKGVRTWVTIDGFSLMEGAPLPNVASAFVMFTDWDKPDATVTQYTVINGLYTGLNALPEGEFLVLQPPPIPGLGNAGGFDLMLEDRANSGATALQTAVQDFVRAANKDPRLTHTLSLYSADTPRLQLTIDRAHALREGLTLSDVYTAISTAFGGTYINTFSKYNQNYQLRVQADTPFRGSPQDLLRLRIRNAAGGEAPLDAFATLTQQTGPATVTRYNLYPSASVQSSPSAGVSSAQGMTALQDIADATLPKGFAAEWTGMSLQEALSQGQATAALGLAILLVYLILCALYANWLLPLGVLLVIPLALSGTVAAISLRGMDNNIYVQTGMLLLMAMSSKNALILMLYARRYGEQGRTPMQAAHKAASVHFRPILMSSLAYAAGAAPMLWASGAGAADQQYLGTAVFGGMVATALLTVLYAPLFYHLFTALSCAIFPRRA